MKLLLVLNRKPYDGTKVTWNALRLLAQAQEAGIGVRVFLMNDAVDLAREEGLEAGDEYDLQGMLLEAIRQGAEAKLCKTCITQCGITEGQVRPEVKMGTMPELVEWIAAGDRVLTF